MTKTPPQASTRPRLDLVVLDTDEPAGLADFYATLLGWEVAEADEDWVTVRGDGAVGLAFQLALSYVRPTWPENAVPQQFHLDLDVPDIQVAAGYAESLGAARVPGQSHQSFLVMVDPSGHPFCLCQAG